MKKWLLLSLLLVALLQGCSYKVVTKVDAEKYGVTDEIIAEQREKFKYGHAHPGMKDLFAVGGVVITVYPFANNYGYTSDDFSYLGCTEVIEWDVEIREGKPSRKMCLQIDAPSKQDVLDAVEVLQLREDVYRAEPLGWAIVD